MLLFELKNHRANMYFLEDYTKKLFEPFITMQTPRMFSEFLCRGLHSYTSGAPKVVSNFLRGGLPSSTY